MPPGPSCWCRRCGMTARTRRLAAGWEEAGARAGAEAEAAGSGQPGRGPLSRLPTSCPPRTSPSVRRACSSTEHHHRRLADTEADVGVEFINNETCREKPSVVFVNGGLV